MSDNNQSSESFADLFKDDGITRKQEILKKPGKRVNE